MKKYAVEAIIIMMGATPAFYILGKRKGRRQAAKACACH